MEECEPYLEYQGRQMLFREGVIAFLGIKDDKEIESKFCETCKAAGMATNCDTCPRTFKLIGETQYAQ